MNGVTNAGKLRIWLMSIRRFVPNSVGVRVALAVNTLVVVTGVGLLTFDYQRESSQRLADKAHALREQAVTLHQAVSGLDRKSAEGQQRFIDAACRRMSDTGPHDHCIVVEIDGKVLQSQDQHRDHSELPRAILSAGERPDDAQPEASGLIVGKYSEAGITVWVGEQMAGVRAEIRRQAVLRSVGLMAFVLVLAVAINLVIHNLVHKPLRRLVKTIDGIAAGDYGTMVGRFEGAELLRLAKAVNAMSVSLAQAEAHRKASLDRARRVQTNLLPHNGRISGMEVAFFHRAAEDVAGDYLDIFQTSRGRTVLCVADVVGHGIAPAMIAAMLKVLLLDAGDVHDDPGDMLGLLNRRFTAVNLLEDFASVFLAVWEPATRTLCYVSAGHEPAIFLPSGSMARLLSSTGPLMGLDPKMTWETHAIQIEPGELLAFWTDGITEAWGQADDQFGRDRLVSLIGQHREANTQELVQVVERALGDHTEDGQVSDDCTFVAIRFE